MANTYAASTFTIDTDTNVAGLTALKGSAPALTDDIIVVADANNRPTRFTVEAGASLSCKSFNIGYSAVAGGGTVSPAECYVEDDVVIKIGAPTSWMSVSEPSVIHMAGTAHTIGTSNASADQQFTQLHSDRGVSANLTVEVDGSPWMYVPALNGLISAITTTTNTTSVKVNDPRITGLGPNDTVVICKTADGSGAVTKTVKYLDATTIYFQEAGNVSVSNLYSVYRVIAATDKVYTVAGGKVIFGDGTASAWDNNGGAIPVDGAVITQHGITCYTDTLLNGYTTYGTCYLKHVDFSKLSNYWGMSGPNCGTTVYIESCSFHPHSASYAGPVCMAAFVTVRGTICVFAAGSTYFTGQFSSDVDADILLHSGNAAAAAGMLLVYTTPRAGYQTKFKGSIRCRSVTGAAIFGNTVANAIFDCTIDISYCTVGIQPSGTVNWTFTKPISLTKCGRSDSAIGNPLWVTVMSEVTFLGELSLSGNLQQALLLSRDTKFYGGIRSGDWALTQTSSTALWSWRPFVEITSLVSLSGTLYWYGYIPSTAMNAREASVLYLSTQGTWYTSDPSWIPGLASYGAATVTVTQFNGSTTQAQFRRSADFGSTWTEWTDIPAAGNLTSDTPNENGEFIQYRVSKTDAGPGRPMLVSINVAVTRVAGWTGVPATYAPSRISTFAGGTA